MMSDENQRNSEGPGAQEAGTVVIPAGSDSAGGDQTLLVTHHAIESSVNPISLFDLGGEIVYTNPAFLRMWGYDSNQAITGLADSLWDIPASGKESPIEQIRGGGDWVGVVRAKKRDGTRFDILASLSLVSGPDPGQTRIMASFLDLAKPLRITAQMVQSAKLAAIGQLAAGVAHEINNPASFVMANLDQVTKYVTRMLGLATDTKSVLRETCGPEVLERIEGLEKSYDIEYVISDIEDLIMESLEGMVRIRNIVSDLRKFSSWGESDREELDLNQMVDSVLNLAMSEVRYRGRLTRHFGKVPTIRSAQGRLANAVLNVVVNAAQSLDPKKAGSNMISVSTGVEGERIFIRVVDTGSGMNSETMDRIFDPFYTTRPTGSGTGLGLVIALDIIQKAGGEISVQSDEGQGSTFTLWLPLPEGEETPVSSRPASQGRRRPRIMVIDDEQPVLKAMQRLLRDRYQVETFLSATEAIAQLETDTSYDLVICDLIMLGMDGQEFYNEVIRRWPRLESRFLFFTGGAYTPELKGFSHAMKDRTIHKPLESGKIINMITKHLKAQGD